MNDWTALAARARAERAKAAAEKPATPAPIETTVRIEIEPTKRIRQERDRLSSKTIIRNPGRGQP